MYNTLDFILHNVYTCASLEGVSSFVLIGRKHGTTRLNLKSPSEPTVPKGVFEQRKGLSRGDSLRPAIVGTCSNVFLSNDLPVLRFCSLLLSVDQ